MNIGKIGENNGAGSKTSNSADRIQQLQKQKLMLSQELKRVQGAKKSSEAEQKSAEKQIEKLEKQIKNIDEQIRTAQTKPADEGVEAAQKTVEAKAASGETKAEADDSTAKSAERRKFDEFVAENEQSEEKSDNTYAVKTEDGRQVVKFNKNMAEVSSKAVVKEMNNDISEKITQDVAEKNSRNVIENSNRNVAESEELNSIISGKRDEK